jgi:L-ascorbate metabolism protein UlaG (beta-lactamase superfamily)
MNSSSSSNSYYSHHLTTPPTSSSPVSTCPICFYQFDDFSTEEDIQIHINCCLSCIGNENNNVATTTTTTTPEQNLIPTHSNNNNEITSTSYYTPPDPNTNTNNNIDDDDQLTDEISCCPICSNHFHINSTLQERQAHINRCLDDELRDPMLRQKYECPICGEGNLSIDALERIRHVKICGKKFGVTAGDLSASRINRETTTNATLESSTEENLQLLLSEAERIDQEDNQQQMNQSFNNNNSSSSSYDKENTSSSHHQQQPVLKQIKISTYLSNKSILSPTTSNNNIPSTKSIIPPSSKRVPDTNLLVDAFEYADPSISTFYLLSHFHSDHYIGLTKKFNAGYIYCSPTTARLVMNTLHVSPKRIAELRINEERCIDDCKVTALPANHCPGSIMFLVKTRNGRTHLHTGDCRLCTSLLIQLVHKLSPRPMMMTTPSSSSNNNKPLLLDCLLLDTTYADPRFNFPSQENSIQLVNSLLAQTSALKDSRTLVVFGAYIIGKEKIALGALPLNHKLGVTKQRLKHIRVMDELSLNELAKFTSDLSSTRFWIVTMADLRHDRLETLLKRNAHRFDSLVAIRATGWVVGGGGGGSSNSNNGTIKKNLKGNVTVVSIPYSEHSSYCELIEALRVLRPKKLIPTVAANSKQADEIEKRLMMNAGLVS